MRRLNGYTVSMGNLLIAYGAGTFGIGVGVKIAKIERKVQAPW